MNLENISKLSVGTVLLIFLNACGSQDSQQVIQPSPPSPETEITISQTEPENKPEPVASNDTAANQRYYCGKSQDGTPTTFARKLAIPGSVAIVRWERDNWTNITPQERCEQVSARFERTYQANNLQYIVGDTFNNQPVVCGVRNYGDICKIEENFLLTLQHRDNLNEFITNLETQGYGAKGPIKNSEDGTPFTYIDMNKLINLAPVEPESES